MSDTYFEDDRKPASVEDREPRDVEKGEGSRGSCHMAYAIKEACRKKGRMETMRIKIDVFTPTLTK
jgi:hypothetical protein